MTRSRKMLWALAVMVVGYVGYSSMPSGAELLSGARDTEAKIAEVRSRLDVADAAARDKENFTENLETARLAVPVDPSLPDVIDAIDASARTAGLSWLSGSPSAAEGDGQTWRLSLTLAGDSRNVPKFVEAIAGLPRLLVIDSLQVRGDRDATIQVALRFFATPGDPDSYPSDQSAGQEG